MFRIKHLATIAALGLLTQSSLAQTNNNELPKTAIEIVSSVKGSQNMLPFNEKRLSSYLMSY
jgi:hypothetical protein